MKQRRRRHAARPTPACAGSTRASARSRQSSGAYPRLRGEHHTSRGVDPVAEGLPPLARGALSRRRPRAARRRPTPACAGSTIRVRPMPDRRDGLPPLARGAPGVRRHLRGVHGPTPACAGSTRRRRSRPAGRRAYPRLRGEHLLNWAVVKLLVGLPPLARGALDRHRSLARRPGPTPACAGSTPKGILNPAAQRAYPRLRGEHGHKTLDEQSAMGLPPLARGAPANRRTQLGATRAYPRLRGEHSLRMIALASSAGLPPLARGARASQRASRDIARPTPACAGSTLLQALRSRTLRAYPRLRGEHNQIREDGDGNQGLPPLARGARAGEYCTTSGCGPTPACAGSTQRILGIRGDAWAYPRLRGEHSL